MKTTKAFKSGNSVAVRLPKSFGIAAGTELTLREDQGRYIVEPVETEPKTIDLTGIAGSCPGLKPVARLRIGPRQLDWSGKLLKRD
jgi:antitoxin VapB